jgi:hypothetical protein
MKGGGGRCDLFHGETEGESHILTGKQSRSARAVTSFRYVGLKTNLRRFSCFLKLSVTPEAWRFSTLV